MVWLPFWAFRMLEKGCASVLSARSGIFRTCAFFVGYLSKRFLRWTLDCRCFSSSLTLREVMEPYVSLQTFWRNGRRFRCYQSGSDEVV